MQFKIDGLACCRLGHRQANLIFEHISTK